MPIECVFTRDAPKELFTFRDDIVLLLLIVSEDLEVF